MDDFMEHEYKIFAFILSTILNCLFLITIVFSSSLFSFKSQSIKYIFYGTGLILASLILLYVTYMPMCLCIKIGKEVLISSNWVSSIAVFIIIQSIISNDYEFNGDLYYTLIFVFTIFPTIFAIKPFRFKNIVFKHTFLYGLYGIFAFIMLIIISFGIGWDASWSNMGLV